MTHPKNNKNLRALTLTGIAFLVIVGGWYLYNQQSSPLPYEEGYEAIYAEQGLNGINFEYQGPNSENPPKPPTDLLPITN